MSSDSDSSDDDLMVPNGFVDVGADTVECDFDLKDDEDSPPTKRKRGKKGKASISSSFDCSQSTADKPPISTLTTSAPTDLESFEILDDTLDVQETSEAVSNDTGLRRSKRKAASFSDPAKQSTKDSEDSSFVTILNESDSVLLSSPEESHQSSFCFDLEEDVSECVIEEDTSNDDEIKVRVVWKGFETRHFNLRKHQKLKEIYTHYAQQEGIEEDRILFTLRDKTVSANDTPSTLNIGVASLEGGITDVAISNRATANGTSESRVDPNALKLFIQRKGMKEKHTVYTYPHEKISVLMSKLSEDLKIPTSSFVLKFDGDIVSPDQTPESLDMEGEECIDLMETK